MRRLPPTPLIVPQSFAKSNLNLLGCSSERVFTGPKSVQISSGALAPETGALSGAVILEMVASPVLRALRNADLCAVRQGPGCTSACHKPRHRGSAPALQTCPTRGLVRRRRHTCRPAAAAVPYY